MDHSRASDLLTDLVDGALDPRRRHELEEHLAECEACRTWVATYRLFAEALSEPQASRVEHLDSHELSAFVLTPDSLDGVTRLRCEEHLAGCAPCRREQKLVREAATAAAQRPRIGAVLSRPAARRRLALAASLLLLLGVLVYARGPHTPTEYSLRGAQLEGSRSFVAGRSIVVGATEVHSGASVTFTSGESVAFDNGFTVAADAQLSVVVDSGQDPERKVS